MSPRPQEQRGCKGGEAGGPNSIVVSGMSGLFPRASSVEEFSNILYNKINPVSDEDLGWTREHPESEGWVGKMPGLERFDSQFFMVHKRLGDAMDPMARKVLEQAYQAIYDAGVSPKHLSGRKVGVYIATGLSETEKYGLIDKPRKQGYGITGISKTMFANRVSYWLNAKGPSLNVDEACCGAVVALEEAVRALRDGTIEAAIVGGANTCLLPQSQVHFNRCMKLSPDGRTRSFDQHADGCCKSEAISVLFLQKAKDALRAYAEVVHLKNEFVSRLSGETGQRFGFVREPATTARFLETFYREVGVPPQLVTYVEACGSALPEADRAELQSIESVFCEHGRDPLLVGSVMSNIGFTEAASGAVALTKVLLAYHTGVVASNLHCSEPRRDVRALQDGRMHVLTEHAALQGRYAAVNCLSFTGVNAHVLLRACTRPKDLKKYKSTFPRLVTLSARQHEFIGDIFSSLKSRPIDPEEHALFHNIHSTNISGHLGRGYIVLDTNSKNETVCLAENMQHSDGGRRPLWLVYSGMGSQWAGMGAQFMRVPIFAAAIQRCDRVLKPQGIDIVHILTTPDKKIFDNVLNTFVGIAAVQIGLTDVLTALGIRPDNIIGHSVGELGCAYADGCLTAEDMILAASSRGRASNAVVLAPGAMAAVGLGYQQVCKLVPPSVDVACHNSAESCTISGPVEAVRAVVASLAANGVFAKEVPTANIAYHSRYIAAAGPHLLNILKDVLKDPKVRSERWLSTSVPVERWGEPIAQLCSAEYLTNNLLSPVLFEETARLIPPNAVLVEVAPHGLLQAILKRALPASCSNVPLTRRDHPDNVVVLLDAMGKLYMEGFEPQLAALYPAVQFPVSAGTPHLAHHVRWSHDQTWDVVVNNNCIRSSSTRSVPINIYDDEHSYLLGNIVQGKALFPISGALVAVWDTLAMTLGVPRRQASVRFRDVHCYSQPILHQHRQLELHISLNRGDGRFEVLQEDSKVATGFVEVVSEAVLDVLQAPDAEYDVDADQIYEYLASHGYSFKGQFRSVASAAADGGSALLLWADNWVTFLEGLVQANAVEGERRGVAHVTQIRELLIDTQAHDAALRAAPARRLPAALSPDLTSDVQSVTRATSGGNYVLRLGTVGELDSLHWEEAPAPPADGAGVPVEVEYAGINVADVNRALGAAPLRDHDSFFGLDFSGTTDNGTRVMGLVRGGAASTRVVARPELLWPVPPHWTLAEAATVPLAYAEAYYYLCVKNELLPGWRVLVQGAAGALGQAAVAVALAHGARVFASVSNAAKKQFLLRLFPQLHEDAIGNSRDESFGDMILNATNGEGCNIVLSCVRGNLKNISLKCAAFSGVTIDMVQIQNRDKFEYGMYNMTKQRSYIAADFGSLLESEKTAELQRLHALVSSGIASGVVRPLTHVSYAPQHAARAFRLLAAARHRGRVLLALRDRAAPVTPRMVLSPAAVQCVVWNDNTFGMQFVDRLIERGAKKIIIYTLDEKPKNTLKLRSWKSLGVEVTINSAGSELTGGEPVSALSLLKRSSEGRHIEGIFVCALRPQREGATLAAVLRGLDAATRTLHHVQPALKYFGVISSEPSAFSSCVRETCVARAAEGFLATAVCFPASVCTEEGGAVRCAVDAAERALCTKHALLYARPTRGADTSLLQLFPILAGAGEARLGSLGLAEALPALQHYLRSALHLALDDDDLLALTSRQLLDIEKKAAEYKFEDVKGMDVFFSMAEHDELSASSEVVPMRTLAANIDTMLGGVDARRAHLFVVPGLEGQHARFTELCARLKVPAVVLQPSLDRAQASPADQAARYAQILLDQFKLKNDFYLLGYEFGIEVALELAAILEDHGLAGTVFCLGDGPEELRELLRRELATCPDEAALQEALMHHLCALLAPAAPSVESARTHMTWPQRVEAAVHALRGLTPHTAQYVRATLNAAYERLQLARAEFPAPRALRSRVVALRARDTGAPRAACSLQRYSAAPLTLHELASPLAHAARDPRVPVLVNKYLDPALLKEFEASNSCYSYVMEV